MNFGDILDDWDKMTSRPIKRRNRAQPDSPPVSREPDSVPVKRNEPSPNERMVAWLNRHGVDRKEDDAVERTETLNKADRETMRPDAVIDLHGLNSGEAVVRLESFMESSSRSGANMVLIIHGKGNHSAGEAVLGKAVRKALETISCAGKRWEAPRRLGGAGALCVLIKKTKG